MGVMGGLSCRVRLSLLRIGRRRILVTCKPSDATASEIFTRQVGLLLRIQTSLLRAASRRVERFAFRGSAYHSGHTESMTTHPTSSYNTVAPVCRGILRTNQDGATASHS